MEVKATDGRTNWLRKEEVMIERGILELSTDKGTVTFIAGFDVILEHSPRKK